MDKYRNHLTGNEQAVLWRTLVKQIHSRCDSPFAEEIELQIAMTQQVIDEGKAVNCKRCHDTGYEDVQGYNRCRNKCTVR